MKTGVICLLLFLTSCYFANAAVFVVTSNADSGPGTLREALTAAAANGIMTDDYINFNLPGNTQTDRTILLLNELPRVSGHLIIDGTTQPGNALGTSTAKVLLKANRPLYRASDYHYGCLNILNVTDVQVYGLAFDQFRSLITKTNPNGQASEGNAIYIVSASEIIIGAPGRGNIFMENDQGIYCGPDAQSQIAVKKLKIQSNWFGLNFDGTESGWQITRFANIAAQDTEFGGPDLSYGNILGGYSGQGLSAAGTNFNIRFNRFGFIGNGNLGLRGTPITMYITNCEFTDNLANRFAIQMGVKNVKILRNKELSDPINVLSQGIYFDYSENVQIGSDDITDVNEFLPSSFGPFVNGGSRNIEIRKNVIHCSPYAYSVRDGIAVSIQVVVNNETEYSGTATPNSEVYIYNDNTNCTSCSPLIFYRKLTADASGKWGITGDFSAMKFVANTTLINVSSEFTQPHILSANTGYWYEKTDPSCGESNGSLALTRTMHLMKVEWYNRQGEKVGEGNKVDNLPPGEYYAKGYNGKCYTTSPYYVTLFNVEPIFNSTNLKTQHPGCGKNNGSIKGIYVYLSGGGVSNVKWVDETGKTVSTGTLELANVGPGSYTLVVTTHANCTKSYGPIKLENTEGPNIYRTAAVLKNANCDNSDGSITGVTATGLNNLQYSWKDEKNNILSHTIDLTGVKAGQYTLEVKDESTCGIISSTFDVFAENAISIDETLVQLAKTTCGKANGSVTGIKINGSGTIKWLNENDEIVGANLDLTLVPAGKYRLLITGIYCSKTSSVFTISEANTKIVDAEKQIRHATCNLNNGSIVLRFIQPPKLFRWINESSPTIILGTANSLSNLSAGFYKLYITDENNCESLYGTYEILAILPPTLAENELIIETDKCGLGTGSIKGIHISGGTAPYKYAWFNQDGLMAGSSVVLENATAGRYMLKVTDSENCEINTSFYTINTETIELTVPEVLPVQICAPGNAIIVPVQRKEGKFRLYQTETASQPIATTTDIFRILVNKSNKYYVSYSIGTCESKRVAVEVEVAETALKIATSFTPNNDGFNDTWEIAGLNNYPEFELQIFNRNGQNIFSTRDPEFAFNGMVNNTLLPVGAYYYVLKLREGCTTINGSLTLIR